MANKKNEPAKETPAAESKPANEFFIQRIYIKDISFESPQSPAVFQQEWQPHLDLQLQTTNVALDETHHEVTLKATASVKSKDKVAFIVEVAQAGIFAIKGFTEDQLQNILGSVCPGILFPYAREAISDLVNRGTFPPLYLAPVNFEALYQQHLHQQTEPAGDSKPN